MKTLLWLTKCRPCTEEDGHRPFWEDKAWSPDGISRCKPRDGHAATISEPTTQILLKLWESGSLRHQLPISATRAGGATDLSVSKLPRIRTFRPTVPETDTCETGVQTSGGSPAGADMAKLWSHSRNIESGKMTRRGGGDKGSRRIRFPGHLA